MANTLPLLGIISALPAEARAAGARRAPVGEPVPISDGVLLLRCGVGRARAAQAATTLVNAGAGALLSWGTAAALGEDLDCGDLLLPEAVLSAGGRRWPVDPGWHREMAGIVHSEGGYCAGSVAEAGRVLVDGADKRRLGGRGDARIADMESAVIAEACEDAGIRLLVVRAVSDRANMRIPSCALAGVNAHGDVQLARCLGKLLLSPGELPALLRLAMGFRAACAALSRVGRRAAAQHFRLPPLAAASPDVGANQA